MSYIDQTKHIAKFGGAIWYVNKGAGSDSNNGKTPDTAFETIGKGITEMSDGDALNIKAGTYTEVGLDLSNDAAEMWCEIGVVIDPASGTALTISGASCRLAGDAKITPAAAATGLLISGTEARVSGVKVVTGATGVLITGTGAVLEKCAVGFPTTTGYDIQAEQVRLLACSTVGNAATIGYKVNNNKDTGVLSDCTSAGHATAGYYIDTGSVNWTLVDCSSGGGDGRWVDVDNANVWSGFTFADEVFHSTDWSVVGGAAGTDNVFKITGSVEVLFVFGNVETQMHADVDNLYLELDDGTNQVNVTGKVGGGTDTNSAEVGSLFIKTETASENIARRVPRSSSSLRRPARTATSVWAGRATGTPA